MTINTDPERAKLDWCNLSNLSNVSLYHIFGTYWASTQIHWFVLLIDTLIFIKFIKSSNSFLDAISQSNIYFFSSDKPQLSRSNHPGACKPGTMHWTCTNETYKANDIRVCIDSGGHMGPTSRWTRLFLVWNVLKISRPKQTVREINFDFHICAKREINERWPTQQLDLGSFRCPRCSTMKRDGDRTKSPKLFAICRTR